MNRRHLLAAAAAALASACTESKPKFAGVDVTGAPYGKDFNLPDADGKPRALAEFKGKLVALFFGYTQCPDACPTTMAELAEAKKLLGAQGDQLQVVFVTVDPARDTAPILKAYMGNFDATFLALRPNEQQLEQVAKDFKVYYKKAEGGDAKNYTMDHTASTYVFDMQGRLRLYERYGSGPQVLAADFKKLLDAA
ncbi:SCO family protein [Ramlibacter sp. PS4R-6]|uniref:SCO family protein n=1 Tax=Ramlibacter sp. PS4R-6 TaxID=3133438 RepID=UPI0030A0060A